jgi:hypothetical protein
VPIQTVVQRNSMVDKYKADCTHMTLTSATPTTTATELAGIVRQPSNWGTTATSARRPRPRRRSPSPSGQTVAGVAFFDALTAGVYRDGVGVTSQNFSSSGTYQATATFTEDVSLTCTYPATPLAGGAG